jgi:hypothetical protein
MLSEGVRVTAESDFRWVAVGSSSAQNAREAGAEAARAALTGTDAKLVLVFCNLRHDLHEVLRGVNATTGGVPLIGCSTAGEMTGRGGTDDSVVVTVLGGPGFRATTTMVTNLAGRQREAGAEAAACVNAHGEGESPIFMMLMDGMVNKQEEILRGAYNVLGAAVPLVGGCAGDSLDLRNTFLLYNDQVLSDGIVAVALSSRGSFGIGVKHGWRPVGEPLMVTKSIDGRVYQLSDEPALDVYLRRLDAPPEAYHDAAAFSRFSLIHPLGLRRRTGHEMRFIVSADFEARALNFLADVPQSGLVWLAEGDLDSILDAADGACVAALEALNGKPALGLLAFDCIARRGVLGEEGVQREVGRVAALAAGVPLAGFYTHGEIARVRGMNGFHNQTMVVLALS